MGLYEWRFRISLAAAQEFSSSLTPRQAAVSRSTRSPPEATSLPWLIRLWRIPGQSTPSFGRAASEEPPRKQSIVRGAPRDALVVAKRRSAPLHGE